MIQLTTIRQQIHNLNPAKAKRMESSGEMKDTLWDYQEQMMEAALIAAREAKLQNKDMTTELMIQVQEMAHRSAVEVALNQIMEELEYIYAPNSDEEVIAESTPTKPVNIKQAEIDFENALTELGELLAASKK